MRDLVAQITSSLLRFPEVTANALSEDEVTLDSVLHGKFTVGRSGLAWLACGPQLEVVHAVTGERFSAYRFSGETEHPPSILSVRDFTWLKRSGLLVGLEEEEGSMLCLYDLGISRVVKAVVIPGRITAIEPLVSYGGASTSTQHLHQGLRWFFGVAAVVTDVGHVLLVDLCLDDLSCTQTELEASDLELVNKFPSDIPRLREGVTQQGRHLCLQLSPPRGTGATALHYVQRTNQLAVGYSDGYLQLWNMKTLKKEYDSQLEGGRVPVFAFTFQEPENDPRNCCYLWAVQSTQDHEGDVVSLRLLQLAFGERKCVTSGKIFYEGLEYCEERFSQDLNGAGFPLRAQATNTRLLSCQTIEKFRHHPDRDDSMNEVASPDTSVSIFSWQVRAYGQGQPSTFIGVFDINRWYHAQMPDSLRAGESLQNCPYLAVWSVDAVVEMAAPCSLLDVVVHDRSLSRALPYQSPPPEQFFNPTTYNFEASCLLNAGIVHLTCSGHQKETLSYLKKSAPSLSDGISNGYSRCLMAGLLSSRLADVQPSTLSQEEQLDAILTTAVETSSLGLITGCIKQWTAEEHPGSAGNLRYILEWAWNKVVHTKEELDGICAPLFDSSSNFTDPQTLQLLQHSQRLLSNLSTIFHCMLNEAQELTHRGLVGLINKSMVSSLIAQYAQVTLWFCRTGLLPESSDEDVLQLSRPFYSFSVIKNYYTGQREELQRLAKDKWCADCLMIDGLVAQCGERLADLWKRDEGGTGQYPPPSLHALLDLYLLENVEESAKHVLVIYLLLDVMYSFPNKNGASVESFPTAFSIPIGLVKLVQGLWLLDHHDHESSLELLLHPATSNTLWPWQHGRVLQALMCQGKHTIALRYLHVMKPPINSTDQAKLCLSVLLHNRCIVEAWSLLRQHANKVNLEELQRFLYETCQELDLMKDLLKLPLGPMEQECLERFLQGTGGFQNRELLMVHYLQQANYVPALQINQTLKMNLAADRDPRMKERSNTRNSILNQYGKVLPRAQRKLAIERAKPYQHPTTVLRDVTRPQPLSTVAKPSATENVLSRAAFIKNVLTKIEEVWVGKDATPEPSPLKSPRRADVLVPSPNAPTLNIPEAFVGTPINMLTKRMSRLLDLVVQPSSQTSPETSGVPGTPARSITSWAAPKSITKAPELSLLHTPQVVKRARALAASAPVFSFTPQSILRTCLRPTPVATPSVSPGRSITPPPRPKESRITFIEEASSPDLSKNSVRWSNGLAANKMTQRKIPSPPPEGGVEAWSEHSDDEEGENDRKRSIEKTKPARVASEVESPVGRLLTQEPVQHLPSLLHRPSLGQEASDLSVQSDTTLEFQDAPSSPGDLVKQTEQLPAESSIDEVVVRLPDMSEPTLSPPDGDTEQTDQEMSTAEMPLSANKDRVEESIEEHHTDATVDKSPTQDIMATPVSELLMAQVLDQCSEVPNNSEPGEEPTSKPPMMVEEPVSEALEIRITEDYELILQQPITEVSLLITEPISETLAVPEHSESVPQELISEPLEQVSEPHVTGLCNHEAGAEEARPNSDKPEGPEEVKTETMETSDLDDFVERQLFDNELTPPSARSTSRGGTDIWTSFNSDLNESESVAVDAAAADTQKSVTSSEAATSESHSVVSLNDSEELPSAESEEESGEEEEEEDGEEDSGSEVEIIEEVKGFSRQQHVPAPTVYLEELSPHEQYLKEQATAVLSLETPEEELDEVMDGVVDEMEEEGEVVMVGLEPADLDEGGGGPVCYTELKPSTTLLVPLELATGHQELLDGAAFQTLGSASEEAQPADPSTFSLMLEPEDEEEALLLEPNNHLIFTQNTEVPKDMESQPGTSEAVLCMEPDAQDSREHVGNKEKLASEMAEFVVSGVPDDEDQLEEQAEEEAVKPTEMTESMPTKENGDHLGDGHENGEVSDMAEVNEAELAHNDVRDTGETSDEKTVPSKEAEIYTDQLPAMDVGPVVEDHVSDANETTAHQKEPLKADSTEVVEKVGTDQEETAKEMREAQRSPARRGRRTVTFPLLLTESEKDLSEEEQTDSKVPSTPRRVTRSSKQLQDSQVPVTPRRSARKTDVQSQNEGDILLTKASKPSSPARRTPQKATPRRGSRRTTDVGGEEDSQKVEESHASNEAVPQVRQSARKKNLADVPEEPQATEEPAKPHASPSRVTRQSSRGLSLALESFQRDAVETPAPLNPSAVTPPRSRRKTAGGTVEKASITLVVDDSRLQNVSRRLTRSQLWSHEEVQEKEEQLVLETPLDVEPVNPLSSALMERLEEEKAESAEEVVTKIVRAKRRTTKSVPSVESAHQNAGVSGSEDAVPAETQELTKMLTPSVRRTRASKVPEPATSPDKDSSVLTSTKPRTRGRKKDSAVKTDDVPEVLSPPATRTRQAAAVPQPLEEKLSSDDITVEPEETKPRKKRTTRAKAVPEPPPPVEINLVSPLVSPAEPVTRAQRRTDQSDPSAPKLNLRRKRMMEAIFPKPVTRRKRL